MCLNQVLEPQMGPALFTECEDVTNRQQILDRSPYSPDEMNVILSGYFSVCTWNRINYLWRPNLKDEADNHLIDLAVASNAKFILSQNLTDLTSGDLRFNFAVKSPEQFLKEVM